MRRKNKRRRSPVASLVRVLTWLLRNVLFTGGIWILYSRLLINHQARPDPAVAGERKEMDTQAAGRLSYYYEAGKGRPLVLLHSINAAASSYEMKPLFEHYRGQRPVYALDLPGYGFSEHSPRQYTPEIFSTAIAQFLETQVGKAADVVALSLSSEFAAQVARTKAELFHSLVLISPSGMTMRVRQAGSSQRMHEFLAAPLWGQALFDLVATRTSIRYFLQRSFVGPVPEELVDYDYATSHQPGAEIVPLYFISGALFTPDALESLYKKVSVPGLVIYDQDAFVEFDGLPGLLESCSNWRAYRLIPSKGLPQFERLEATVKALDDFWAKTV